MAEVTKQAPIFEVASKIYRLTGQSITVMSYDSDKGWSVTEFAPLA